MKASQSALFTLNIGVSHNYSIQIEKLLLPNESSVVRHRHLVAIIEETRDRYSSNYRYYYIILSSTRVRLPLFRRTRCSLYIPYSMERKYIVNQSSLQSKEGFGGHTWYTRFRWTTEAQLRVCLHFRTTYM